MKKNNFYNFQDLASAMNPDLKDSVKNRQTAESDLVADLKSMRIDAKNFDSLKEHHFNSLPKPEVLKAFKLLGDQLYSGRVVDQWKDLSTNELERLKELLKSVRSDVDFKFESPCTFVLKTGNLALPNLPRYYAFKGGVARKALAQTLRLNTQTSAVRDMDVFYQSDSFDPSTHELIAKTYMQDDWMVSKKPHRIITKQPSLKGYFRTREFTMNQTMLMENQLTCTAQGLCDLITGTIRPTRHHLRLNRGEIDSIVAAKAIRFYIQGIHNQNDMQLGPFSMKRNSKSHFHFAIHFSRALEQGEAVAIEYLAECRKRGVYKINFDGSIKDAVRQFKKKPHVKGLSFGCGTGH